jgi:hypothetical protein
MKGVALGAASGYVAGQLATPADAGGAGAASTVESTAAGGMTAETAGMTDGVTELMATDFGAVNPASMVDTETQAASATPTMAGDASP